MTSWATSHEVEEHHRAQYPLATGVRLYVYRDETERPVHGKLRIDNPKGYPSKKVLLAFGYVEGRWALGTKGLGLDRLPLLNVPELGNVPVGEWVFVVEGEKTAETGEGLSLPFTTSGGSGSVAGADWSPLKGRKVAVLPDNDEAGAKYAQEVAKAALEAGAVEVRIVELGLTGKGDDLVEFVTARQSKSTDAVRNELFGLVNNTKPVRLGNSTGFPTRTWGEAKSSAPVEWLVRGLLPRSSVNVMFGQSGSGKSFLALDLAARIIHGKERWLGGEIINPGPVVYLACEGYAGLGARVRAWSIHHHEEIQRHHYEDVDANAKGYSLLSEKGRADLERFLDEFASAQGAPVLVVIDTLAQSVEGSESDDETLRPALSCLDRIARKHGSAVLVVHHPRKGDRTSPNAELGLDDLRGSSIIRGNVGAVLVVNRKGDNRSVIVGKQKEGTDGARFAFELLSVPTGIDSDGRPETSCVPHHKEGKVFDLRADDRLKAEREAKEFEEAIVAASRSLPGKWLSKDALIKTAGFSPSKGDRRSMIELLEARGVLERQLFAKTTDGPKYQYRVPVSGDATGTEPTGGTDQTGGTEPPAQNTPGELFPQETPPPPTPLEGVGTEPNPSRRRVRPAKKGRTWDGPGTEGTDLKEASA
jgi:hypothetical protein